MDRISPEDLGYKSLAVNLSDIAAMGGRPFGAFLSLGIPEQTGVDWLDRFFSGFSSLASEENVFLLGGDTTASPDRLVINVAVLGSVHPSKCKMRSAAEVKDIICVTGCVGDSTAGLRILLEDLPRNDITEKLIESHHKPRPHTAEGAWLSDFEFVHAMIDLSDGIHSDIQRIMERSDCGAAIDLNRLPLSSEIRRAASQFHWDPSAIGVSGGEDYILLCTVSPSEFHSLADEFYRRFGRNLPKIGTILPADSGLSFFSAGRKVKTLPRGFEHFPS